MEETLEIPWLKKLSEGYEESDLPDDELELVDYATMLEELEFR